MFPAIFFLEVFMEYKFDAAREAANIKQHMTGYFSSIYCTKAIVGVSGGKDSAVTLKLACDVLGKENVLGVMMPNGYQKDISDSKKIIEFCGCPSVEINIAEAYNGLVAAFEKSGKSPLEFKTFRTNTPARIRMTTLYGLSAIEGGLVLNTCNLSEDCAPGNYSTLFGDNAGSYSTLQGFTVTEVRAIGDVLGMPVDLVHKTPDDGMCGFSDEENISRQTGINGFTYQRFDRLIRMLDHDFNPEEVAVLKKGFTRGKFKNEIVQIPHYVPDLPNFFESN